MQDVQMQTELLSCLTDWLASQKTEALQVPKMWRFHMT